MSITNKDYNLSFRYIKSEEEGPFQLGRPTTFKIYITNNASGITPKVQLKVVDETSPNFGYVVYTSEPFNIGGHKKYYCDINAHSAGKRKLKFEIMDLDTKEIVLKEYKYFDWIDR